MGARRVGKEVSRWPLTTAFFCHHKPRHEVILRKPEEYIFFFNATRLAEVEVFFTRRSLKLPTINVYNMVPVKTQLVDHQINYTNILYK